MRTTLIAAALCSLWLPLFLPTQTNQDSGSMATQQDTTSTGQRRKQDKGKTPDEWSGSQSTTGAATKTPQTGNPATSDDITPGTSGSAKDSTSEIQPGSSGRPGRMGMSSADMMTRMNQLVDHCMQAQTSLYEGERLVRQSMGGASAASRNTLSQADQRLADARNHLELCNRMLGQMRDMHAGVRGFTATQPRTDNADAPR